MKTKVILVVFCIVVMFCMSVCSGDMEKAHDNQDSRASITTSRNIDADSTEKSVFCYYCDTAKRGS